MCLSRGVQIVLSSETTVRSLITRRKNAKRAIVCISYLYLSGSDKRLWLTATPLAMFRSTFLTVLDVWSIEVQVFWD
jgi:hypothetical protein